MTNTLHEIINTVAYRFADEISNRELCEAAEQLEAYTPDGNDSEWVIDAIKSEIFVRGEVRRFCIVTKQVRRARVINDQIVVDCIA